MNRPENGLPAVSSDMGRPIGAASSAWLGLNLGAGSMDARTNSRRRPSKSPKRPSIPKAGTCCQTTGKPEPRGPDMKPKARITPDDGAVEDRTRTLRQNTSPSSRQTQRSLALAAGQERVAGVTAKKRSTAKVDTAGKDAQVGNASVTHAELVAEAFQVALRNWAKVVSLSQADESAELALYVAVQALSASKQELQKLRIAASALDPRTGDLSQRRDLACLAIVQFTESDKSNYEELVADVLPHSQHHQPYHRVDLLDDAWLSETLRRAEKAIMALRKGTSRNELPLVNMFLEQFGLHVEEYSAAERAAWDKQQRKNKQHRLESVMRRARTKYRVRSNTGA